MRSYSRRQTLALAAGTVLFGSIPSADQPIVVNGAGTVADALADSFRAVLGSWSINGKPYPYIAAFDGLVIPLESTARRFSITHNGNFVTEPLSQRRVRTGDELRVAALEC